MKQLLFLLSIFITCTASAQTNWIQRVDTKIDVTLNDNQHTLSAYEEFTYTNNSPDTLKYLFIHLWPNAYKHDHTPFAKQLDVNGNTSFYFSKAKDKGYIDSLQFTIDGQGVDYYSTEDAPDIARIDLLKPLYPGESVKVATPFKVKIPIVFSRLGHTGQAYFISQWFPKPAVYDRKGWHPISFLDQGEFYSNYGSYDVSITLPANYVVMATGNCTDEKEMKWLDELAAKPLPSDTLYTHSTPTSDIVTKTLHYHEDKVHDFAWFADKRWVVQKDTVLSPGTNELVTAWTGFLPAHQKQWIKATDYLKETVKHYGKWVGPYTYKTIKAVEGDMHAGGGMEYPTVTVIDRSALTGLKTVVIHEAGHNWFYGMLGSNERDHAWMDEGMNTFYEQKTTRDLQEHPHTMTSKKSSLDENTLYYNNVSVHQDQAIDQTSANFEKLNYGLDVYYKTALMMNWLEQYMGKEDFESGMKDYYNTWRYNHPYPEDFQACMKKHTTKNIDWFFDPILTTKKRIDFVITDATIEGNNTIVTIRNNTGVLSPVLVNAYPGGSDSATSSAWSAPFAETTTITLPGTDWSKLKIDDVIPDAKTTNDVYRRHALSHHFGLNLKPELGLNLADKDKVFISPAFGNNMYDGLMFGVLIHNLTIPQNRFRFAVAPLYSPRTGSLAGTGAVGYVWYPENIFKEIMLQGEAKTFYDDKTTENLNSPLYARYIKLAPSILFTFNEHNPLSPVTRTLLLKGYSISDQSINFGVDSTGKPTLNKQQKMYGLLRYKHENNRTYNPFGYSLEGQMGADFAKINLEGNIRIDYNARHKSLYVRGYIGKFFAINDDPSVTSRYELNASYTGVDDYLYDGTYKGRDSYSRIGAQQISIQEGGFKIPTFNGVDRSDNWMATINLKTDLPLGKLPIRLFFDAGLIPNATPTMQNSSSTTLLYDGGVEIHIYKDIASIYIPVIMSSDFQNYLQSSFGRKNEFARSISFTFQLQNINWLKTPDYAMKLLTN